MSLCKQVDFSTARKQVFGALGKLAECKKCGGSRMVKATAWRHHGTGQRGVSVGTPTAHEELKPEIHCTCVGGPLWEKLCSLQFGRDLQLAKVPMDEYDEGRACVWMAAEGDEPAGWWQIPAARWREMLIKIWPNVSANKPALDCLHD